MSDQKLVSPLLDGFIMGEPMSSHDGVRCCPAVKEDSDDKYIVKIISIPASQNQLDALLLTGACKDAAAAADYFKELADDVVREARLLQQLSRLEGFLSYDGWQLVPMEDNKLGYDIYLLGTYKRSLEKFLRSNTMTHLSAVNLGLDLCAALSICRRAGYIHVDLKPGNIYLCGDREYRIGDLGFVKLKSLKYAALPSKYRSCYTPPELHDDMATLNPTVDIYAVGLILYRIYNNGKLPFEGHAPAEELPAPANADYEMAEIILKACNPNPRHRWQTPIEMGQALASYMQRNTVNDIPIVPPVIDNPIDEEEVQEAAEEETETAEIPEFDETAPSEENIDDLPEGGMTDEFNAMFAQADDLLSAEVPDAGYLTGDPEDELVSNDTEPAFDEPADDESAEAELPEGDMDDEDTQISRLLRSYGSHRYTVEDDEGGEEDDELDEAFKALRKEDDHASIGVSDRKKGRGWVGFLVFLLVAALAAGAGYYYYSNYYLLPIDNLEVSVAEDTILVNVTTDVDEALLTVVCTDTYGNVQTRTLSDGTAKFTQLNAGTQYQITVTASGFHQTSNVTSRNCTTSRQTQILDFTAKTGAEDGAVILNFTVDGPGVEDWVVEYSAAGEEPKSLSFTGHMVTVTGLTLDQVYTFELIPASSSDLWLVGNTTLEYTAKKNVVAENVEIVSCSDGILNIQWNVPEDAAVESWNVRCYDDSGFDQTITVSENTAQFTGINAENAHTIEVTAAGMTQSARAYLSANATTITDISVSEDNGLQVSWNYTGNAPAGGWLLMYSTDGGRNSEVVSCTEASGAIANTIPGATYQITIQTAAGSTVFGGETQFTCAQAADFNQYSLSTDEVMISLCQTPDKSSWNYNDVSGYTSTYASGSKVSMVVYATAKFYRPSEDIELMFIIRDAEGNVRTDLLSRQTIDWRSIWSNGYAYLDIPSMPIEAGEYTVDLYWGGAHVVTKEFTITE